MNCAIFTGGEFPQKELAAQYVQNTDYVIAADSGLVAADSYGMKCDFVIGDMDSVPERLLEKYVAVKHEVYARDKDFTDTELALKKAAAVGADTITLVGGGGGSIDHFFALRDIFSCLRAPDVWLCAENAVFCIDAAKKCALSVRGLRLNDAVSVFPVWVRGEDAHHTDGETETRGTDFVGGAQMDSDCVPRTEERYRAVDSVNGARDCTMDADCMLRTDSVNGTRATGECIRGDFVYPRGSCVSQNLYWPLDTLVWNVGFASLRNRAKNEKDAVCIRSRCGRYLVTVPLRSDVVARFE